MWFEFEGKARTYHGTFVVRRGPQHQKAPILVLAAANTWRAYSGTPFFRDHPTGDGAILEQMGSPVRIQTFRRRISIARIVTGRAHIRSA